MSSKAVIYARTSPDCPLSAEEQIECLNTVATNRGWTVANVFIDRPAMARTGRGKRPGETALLDAIRGGGVEKVLLSSIDRVGRSLVDFVGFVEACRTASVTLWLHTEQLDTTNNGLSLFDLCEMMAFHLRQSRRDRILRGQAAVRGLVRFGRPPILASKAEKAKQLLTAGKGVREVARLAGISASAASRLKGSIVSAAA